MAIVKWTFIVAASGYLALAALMYFAQRSLMYFPERVRTAPAAAGFPEAQEVWLDTADGERVIAWHVPPRGDSPVVIYFHGNGGSIRLRVDRFQRLVAAGVGLLGVSYRGYGGSTGSPSEAGLIADAEAAYTFAAARTSASQIVAFGESLGTGVAIALAATHRLGGVILQAPFTSAADIGARVYWFLPVRLLMKDAFRSDLRIAKVTAPLLVMHGERDTVVPIAFGERLFALANEPKRFVRFAEGAHHDLDQYGALEAVRTFIGRISP